MAYDPYNPNDPQNASGFGAGAGAAQNQKGGIDASFSGTGMGNQNAPMTTGQFWNTFQDPNREANDAAIQGMRGQQLQGYQPGGSSLAGVTTLGAMQNAKAATIDQGQSQNLMGGQIQNINALNAQAQGQGPSVAAEVARQQGEQQVKAGMAMLGSQRGAANSALGIRAAQDQSALAGQQVAQNATMGRAQEAMAARQQLGGALSGATQQAQQGAQAQAQLSQQTSLQNAQAANQMTSQQGQMDQQTALANLQAQLQAGQININQYNSYAQQLIAQNNNDWGAQMNAETQMADDALKAQGIYHNGVTVQGNSNTYGQFIMPAVSAGGSLLAAGAAAASDERLKTSIRSATRGIKDFLSQIGGSGLALMEAS